MNKKHQERRAQRLLQKKRLWDEDGEVQDLAVPKRIKRAALNYFCVKQNNQPQIYFQSLNCCTVKLTSDGGETLYCIYVI